MGYCTVNDIKLNIDITTFDSIVVDTNSSLLTDLITYVSSLMDGVLSKSYAVPILNSAILTDICVKLVLCRLYDRRNSNNISKPEPISGGCKEATDLLNEIANGNYPIFDNTGTLISSNSITFELSGGEEVFTDSILDNYLSL